MSFFENPLLLQAQGDWKWYYARIDLFGLEKWTVHNALYGLNELKRFPCTRKNNFNIKEGGCGFLIPHFVSIWHQKKIDNQLTAKETLTRFRKMLHAQFPYRTSKGDKDDRFRVYMKNGKEAEMSGSELVSFFKQYGKGDFKKEYANKKAWQGHVNQIRKISTAVFGITRRAYDEKISRYSRVAVLLYRKKVKLRAVENKEIMSNWKINEKDTMPNRELMSKLKLSDQRRMYGVDYSDFKQGSFCGRCLKPIHFDIQCIDTKNKKELSLRGCLDLYKRLYSSREGKRV